MGLEISKRENLREGQYVFKEVGDVKDREGNVVGQGTVSVISLTKQQLLDQKSELEEDLASIEDKLTKISELEE